MCLYCFLQTFYLQTHFEHYNQSKRNKVNSSTLKCFYASSYFFILRTRLLNWSERHPIWLSEPAHLNYFDMFHIKCYLYGNYIRVCPIVDDLFSKASKIWQYIC